MKNKIALLTIISAIFLSPYVLTANEGLANKKYAGLIFTNTKFESEAVGLNELSLSGQYPINTNISLTGRAALQWKNSIVTNQESEYDGTLFELGMYYNFLPNTSVNPFIGGTDIGLWCSPTFIPKISAMYDLDKKIQQFGLSANFLI